jgi:hypothetical protein
MAEVCVVPTISPKQWIVERIGEAKRYFSGRSMGEKTKKDDGMKTWKRGGEESVLFWRRGKKEGGRE